MQRTLITFHMYYKNCMFSISQQVNTLIIESKLGFNLYRIYRSINDFIIINII